MSDKQQQYALRHSAAYTFSDDTAVFLFKGDDCFDAVDSICCCDMQIEDGQILHTLFLDENAFPVADVFVCLDDEDFYIIAQGSTPEALLQYFRRHIDEALDLEIVDLNPTHSLVSINGPYAFDVLGKLLETSVVGLPYLTFYRQQNLICFRTGKTGEYGYDVLVPNDELDDFKSALIAQKEPFDMVQSSRENLEQCALENWFFNINVEGRAGLTPLELQLQWRVSYRKKYVGSEALLARKKRGITQRLTTFVCDAPVSAGMVIQNQTTPIGKVVNAGHSFSMNRWVGIALLSLEFAWPGQFYSILPNEKVIDENAIDENAIVVETVSPPVLNNRSLVVSPQVHMYKHKDKYNFEPVYDTNGIGKKSC